MSDREETFEKWFNNMKFTNKMGVFKASLRLVWNHQATKYEAKIAELIGNLERGE